MAAAGGDAELAEYIASGNKLFHTTCVACHGAGGVGITGNGKPLVRNAFVQSLDDDALLAFVKQGRTPTDPKNTTGIQMPPKGGNPAMSDDDILDVIAYLRTLQGGAPGAP
jgi:disulfide bond formation protein DsbB